MTRISFGTGTAAVAFLAFAAPPAAAQEFALSINPYVGYYHFDESSFEDAFDESDVEADPIYGVRLGIGDRRGISYDLAYGRASVDGSIAIGDVVLAEDSAIHLFYGAVNWQFPLPIGVFVSGGLGAIRYSPDERDGQTDLLVNYGAGVSIPTGLFRVRGDAKGHVDLCEAPESFDISDFGACVDDETLHNIELSVGIEIPLRE